MGSYDFPSPPQESLDAPKPWIETPLIYSPSVSRRAGCNIYLKLENLQPSGSFKSRGIGNLMLSSLSPSRPPPHFLCSSGGNAGLACGTTSLSLSRPSTIVVPTATSPLMVSKLRALSPDGLVTVIQTGDSWFEADQYLRNELLKGSDKVYVPPFDHPEIWEGCTSMIDEIVRQFPEGDGRGKTIDGIVASVGGGGLVNGICMGVEKNLKSFGGRRPKVLAIETVGADSLYQSVRQGERVELGMISSIATSLGARRVSEKTWELANGGYGTKGKDFISATVTDRDAAIGCIKFLDDARFLVEVACGATVVTAYNGDLRKHLGGEDMSDEEWKTKNIILVVCGGSNVDLEMLGKYKEVFDIPA
ncbi:tryptophan synthase beta subunit-like PLP-dependent enzyme [Cladorrhinum samala]|uniref:L-serine ammonia-lyase n=1 Tax=Cladorrhinum samala TaxID=585594 RepID=A0AAV9HEA7_9PEZI|nr:tryptophan synthase beta subunit-like PLP-dependent enzyme [Cladorrhinum samala]